jgi:hypothetical protein
MLLFLQTQAHSRIVLNRATSSRFLPFTAYAMNVLFLEDGGTFTAFNRPDLQDVSHSQPGRERPVFLQNRNIHSLPPFKAWLIFTHLETHSSSPFTLSSVPQFAQIIFKSMIHSVISLPVSGDLT